MSTKTSSESAQLKLYYFNARGRAETMRLTLVAAGMNFEDKRMTGEQWTQMKKDGVPPFGQMPFIEYKGKRHGESKALASFIARLSGMAGKTPEDALRVDEVYCLVGSLMDQMVAAMFESDAARKETMMKKLKDETTPLYLGFLEKLLEEDGSGYFVAPALTMADLVVYDFTDTLLKRNSPSVLEAFPRLKNMRALVEKNSKVKAYLDTRPVTEF